MPVIGVMDRVDRMALDGSSATAETDQHQVVAEVKGALVKEDMMIWTEVQDVVRGVRSVVRGAERANVSAFRIGPAGCLKLQPTYLALEVVLFLHPACDRRVANDPHGSRQCLDRLCVSRG